MYASQPLAAYRSHAAETAGPAQLVLMLFDGVLARIEGARAAGGPEGMHDQLVRLQAIVHELRVTLDHERGGQIAANLEALYVGVEREAVEANLTKDVARLAPVESVLRGLRDAWDAACVSGAGGGGELALSGTVHGA